MVVTPYFRLGRVGGRDEVKPFTDQHTDDKTKGERGY
jgi:hypothetical protein